MRALLSLCLAVAIGPVASAQAGFDVLSLNRAVDPCGNFYQYACGGWRAANPIPADVSRWGSFDVLADRNRTLLQNILETASAQRADRTPLEQKIGDYYAACMDEATLNSRSMDTLQRDLNRIAVVDNKPALNVLMVTLRRLGSTPFFNFGSEQDAKDSTKVIAGLDQGGLGLPDRDYYIKADEKSVEVRAQYRAHVERMFRILGYPAEDAQRATDAVIAIETALAEASLDRVSRRDPEKLYHLFTLEQLQILAPEFDWTAHFAGLGTPQLARVNVSVPEFFAAFSRLLNEQSLDNIKAYLTWDLVNSNSVMLNAALRQEHFEFFEKTLRGAKEPRPRWKVCVDLTDAQLPDALGQKFIERTLGVEGVRRMAEMVAALERAMERDIRALAWMTDATKAKAIEKLHKIANKVGNQAKWRDYAEVRIARDDAYGNAARAGQFELAREFAKIGQPVDKDEWFMSQPTVNAYYDPQNNNINFPAGILQPPFFDNAADEALNLGGIGAVIGHELTHGFDDEGRQFDGDGNLQDWWTEADAKAFAERADCLVDQYSAFSPVPGVTLNGKLTLGENTADNGGLRIAYMALQESLEKRQPQTINGFTEEQRLFLGWAQVWCQNITDENARLRAQTDPHSTGEFRVNGVLGNMPEFAKAFACRTDQPMVRANACRVW
jgi:putative endopeptidase